MARLADEQQHDHQREQGQEAATDKHRLLELVLSHEAAHKADDKPCDGQCQPLDGLNLAGDAAGLSGFDCQSIDDDVAHGDADAGKDQEVEQQTGFVLFRGRLRVQTRCSKESHRGGRRGKQQVGEPSIAGDRQKVGNRAEQRFKGPGDANNAEKMANLFGREVALTEMRLDRLGRQASGRLDDALNEIEHAKEGQQGPDDGLGVLPVVR